MQESALGSPPGVTRPRREANPLGRGLGGPYVGQVIETIGRVFREALESFGEAGKLTAEAVRSARDVLVTSVHPLGTCRMSRDPKAGVVGLDHETHDLPGLWVVDASTLPTTPGVNPQLTVMALATRAAEKINAKME